MQGEGDTLEGAAYGSAASLATLNAEYTKASTNIQLAQQQRQQSMVIGKQKSEFAGAGLQQSGSAIDIMANSASQGALSRDVTQTQGLITAAGYNEQATSYTAMQGAANLASEEQTLAAEGEGYTQQSYEDTAQQYRDTASAYTTAAKGEDISAVISAVGGVFDLATTVASAGAGSTDLSNVNPDSAAG